MSNEVKKEIEEEEGVCRAAEDVCVMSVGESTFFSPLQTFRLWTYPVFWQLCILQVYSLLTFE